MESVRNQARKMYVGLDIGTDSVGYAVTDEEYKLLKKHGEPMWGSTVFEAGNTKAERRGFRTARRRLDRRQQRVRLTQEIFAPAIAKVDERFFIRIQESALYREDTSTQSQFLFFEDSEFTDKEYNLKYPTIHHLIQDLITDTSEKDVRLVYLATAWFMAHRGHFLNEVDKTNIDAVLDFHVVYDEFVKYWEEHYSFALWECDEKAFQEIMKKKLSISVKEKEFFGLLNNGKKFKELEEESISRSAIIKLLSGGQIKTNKIFLDLEESEAESVSLGMEEEVFTGIVTNLGDSGELLLYLRKIYDWALLEEILAGEKTLSAAKVRVYDQHKNDLLLLKRIIRKYLPEQYNYIFRVSDEKIPNYAAYSGHNCVKKCNKEVFLDFLGKQLKNVTVDADDQEAFEDIQARIALRTFLPKQVDGDNRVIPYQLYWAELNKMLINAERYLPFLSEKDEDGYTNSQKILSIFEFRIPYYVGPLNTTCSVNSWMKRKEGMQGKIYPWNFEKMVDLDVSEQRFIDRMTNQCSYLPGENVIPHCSLLYSKFTVLNEINNIKVNGQQIPVEIKWRVYDQFLEHKKVTVKMIRGVLLSNGCMQKDDILSGLDEKVNSSLASYHAFKSLLNRAILSEEDVERIIERMAYSEDKIRMKTWLNREFPQLSAEDTKYVLRLKLKDFGRLSKRLLTGLQGVDKDTGEITTIIEALWNTNNNLMQLLSDRYTFAENIEAERKEYYSASDDGIDQILDDMYISNSVKRPIYRSLAILKDIRKATKRTPDRIFIEMARGGGKKGVRTRSRRDQILEKYAEFDQDEVRELSKELEGKSDNELQSEVYFLYFMQLGRCMYSGNAIDINQLKTDKYNVDHIYPRCKVKDDSLTNKVLVLSERNSDKGDNYPIKADWRHARASFWATLKKHGMLSEEKYQRLMRGNKFTDDELSGFINRQLVETRQSTKALAVILKRFYPEAEIVYVKAGLVSEFRQEFGIVKSRAVNDLHHGKDAYLNIVCGNVYHSKFTKNFSVKQKYTMNTKPLFSNPVVAGKTTVWRGQDDLGRIKGVLQKNHLHYTRFAIERKGGFFDQMPVKAGKGSITRKDNLPIDKYGGYNKTSASYFLLVRYQEKKKTDVMFMPVELYRSVFVLESEENAKTYAREMIADILGKPEEIISIVDFPLGLRKIKINTVLSMDGFRVSIAATSSGKTKIVLASMESLDLNGKEQYVKKLENFMRKYKDKKISRIVPEYDEITEENNKELYDLIMQKVSLKKFQIMFGKWADIFQQNRDNFDSYSLEDQTAILLNMVNLLKTGRSVGCDLEAVGGKKNSGIKAVSVKLSNWKKSYQSLQIVDYSASGIFQSTSSNLLELL